MPHVSKVACRPPGAASPCPSPAGRPSQAPSVGVSSHTVASPPSRAKLHHGSASLPWSPCSPGLRLAKIQAARAGVIVMALMAEMIIATEMVRANWRKNWPVMPPRKALGRSTELSTSVMARIGPVISFIALMVASRTRQALLQPALDVLQHDDGVVHDDADGQHQPEQRQVVQA